MYETRSMALLQTLLPVAACLPTGHGRSLQSGSMGDAPWTLGGFMDSAGPGLQVGVIVMAFVAACLFGALARRAMLQLDRRALLPGVSSYSAQGGPVGAGDAVLVVVTAKGRRRAAKLEVGPDSFETYDELHELVLGSLPDMFDDSDELVLDCLDEKGRWKGRWTEKGMWTLVQSSHSRASVNVKASGNVKMSCNSSGKMKKNMAPIIRGPVEAHICVL